MKDEAKFFSSKEEFETCLSCFQSKHTIQNCPFLHYVPNRLFYIRKHTYNMSQQRNTIIKRRKNKRMNALKKIVDIQEKAERLNSLEEISELSASSDEGEKTSVLNVNNDIKRKFSKRSSQLKVTLIDDNKKKPGTFLLDESEVFNMIILKKKIFDI